MILLYLTPLIAVFLEVGSDFDGAGGTFTFDPSRTVYSYNVSLVDDDIYEFTENFFAQLSFVGTPAEPERVSIDPDMALVEVEDDDGKLYNYLFVMVTTVHHCVSLHFQWLRLASVLTNTPHLSLKDLLT